MSRQFSIGQKVLLMHDSGEFTIHEFKNKKVVIVLDKHGFLREMLTEHVIDIQFSRDELLKKNPTEKDRIEPKKTNEKSLKVTQSTIIDLHMHELIDNHRGWTNTEILNYQMKILQERLEYFMKKKVKRVEIVHGVGEQVLMREVRNYLRKFKNCEVNDLNYTRNGFGATEFIIRYKGNVL